MDLEARTLPKLYFCQCSIDLYGLRLRAVEVARVFGSFFGRPDGFGSSDFALFPFSLFPPHPPPGVPLTFLSAFTCGRSLQSFYNYLTISAGLQSLYIILLQIGL